MAKSVGFGMVEFASEFHRLKPDVVLMIGDRYEALAATIAAAYMNLCIVHVQGGEVSGRSTKAPATRSASSLTSIFPAPSARPNTWCAWASGPTRSWAPAARRAISPARSIARWTRRSSIPAAPASTIDVAKPFLLVVFHPTTTEFGGERRQMEVLLAALDRLANADAALVAEHRRRLGPYQQGDSHVPREAQPELDAHADEPDARKISQGAGQHGLRHRQFEQLCPRRGLFRHAGRAGRQSPEGPRARRARRRRPIPLADRSRRQSRKQLAHGRYAPSTLYGDGNVRTGSPPGWRP